MLLRYFIGAEPYCRFEACDERAGISGAVIKRIQSLISAVCPFLNSLGLFPDIFLNIAQK